MDIIGAHQERDKIWMELSAVSDQPLANSLFGMPFAES
jgi:hypothetical protein